MKSLSSEYSNKMLSPPLKEPYLGSMVCVSFVTAFDGDMLGQESKSNADTSEHLFLLILALLPVFESFKSIFSPRIFSSVGLSGAFSSFHSFFF